MLYLCFVVVLQSNLLPQFTYNFYRLSKFTFTFKRLLRVNRQNPSLLNDRNIFAFKISDKQIRLLIDVFSSIPFLYVKHAHRISANQNFWGIFFPIQSSYYYYCTNANKSELKHSVTTYSATHFSTCQYVTAPDISQLQLG